MDNCLPQMESFDFDALQRFDPIAFEQTLTYLNGPISPQLGDDASFSYTGMLENDVGDMDCMMAGALDMPLEMEPDQVGQPGTTCLNTEANPPSPPMTQNLCTDYASQISSAASIDSGSSSIQQHCTWDGCEVSLTGNSCRATHLEIHVVEARAHWTPTSKCKWRGCLSKATFKSISMYDHHLKNMHTKPLITAHDASTKVYIGPYESCEQQSKTFIRKDKWLQHIREVQHLNDAFCPYSHCSSAHGEGSGGFKNRKAISGHFKDIHGVLQGEGYRCGLASCRGEGGDDFWSLWGLSSHLELEHGLEYAWNSTVRMHSAGRRVLLVEDIDGYDVENRWYDCSTCAQTDQTEELITEG